MGRRRQTDEPESLSPLARRIKHLCDQRWQGNMSRMGRELGISHPVMSRVLAGTQPPPGKMLEALAKLPGMNLRWLFAGEGDLHGELDVGAGGGHFCPVAAGLLPGKPQDHPERLTFTTLPVASPFYSETAYWYRVGADDPILGCGGLRFAANDYLLVETSERWTRRPEAFQGRLVVVEVPSTRRGKDVALAVIGSDEDYFAEGAPYEAYILGEDAGRKLYSARMRGATPQCAQKGGELEAADLYLDDLVGVCISMTRILDRVRLRHTLK